MKITEELLQKTFQNVAEMYNLPTDFNEDHFKLDYDGGVYGYEIVKVEAGGGAESYPLWYPTGERMEAREMYRYLQSMIKIKMAQNRNELN